MQIFYLRVMPYSEVVELDPALLVDLIDLLHQFVLSVVQVVDFFELLVEEGVHSLQLALQVEDSALQLLVPSRFLQLFQVFLAIEFELLRALLFPSLELRQFLLVVMRVRLLLL